jgi:hypothetical protein
MLQAAPLKVTRKKSPTRFPGIIEFTRLYNLDRTHVYRVLSGKRESRRLMIHWENFLRAKQEAGK